MLKRLLLETDIRFVFFNILPGVALFLTTVRKICARVLSRRRFTFTLRTDLGGRIEDRLYNFVIAGASAQVSRERIAHFGLGRFGIVIEQRLGRHQKSRRADAALEARMLEELALQRMQYAGGREAFDR